MALLDLDARRAEREGDGHEVKLGGNTYTLPPALPMIVAEYLSEMKVTAAIAALFGEDAVDDVAPLISDEDLNAIMEDVYKVSARAEAAAAPTAPVIPTTGRTSNGTRKKALQS